MTDANDELIDRVVALAKEIEDADTLQELEEDVLTVLGRYVKASLDDGEIREIYLVNETGGPQLEIALYAGRVDGYWSGSHHDAPIMDEDADALLDALADRYKHDWEHNVIA